MGYAKNDYDEKSMARAKGLDLGISTKSSIEVCNFIRYKTTSKAKQILEGVIKQDVAIPFKRFNWDVGHKPGAMGPGRYPLKISQEILRIIKQVESNAVSKGLSTDNLIISHLVVNKASRPWRQGRQTRTKAKRSHIEIIVKEVEAKPIKKAAKPVTKEAKPVVEEVSTSKTEDVAKPSGDKE
jgi:large subunit ribosomal protein L22